MSSEVVIVPTRHLEQLVGYYGIDPGVLSATYKVFLAYYYITQGSGFLGREWAMQQLDQGNALACCTLIVAFRVAWKFVDDFFDPRVLERTCSKWLQRLPTIVLRDWISLEASFLKDIGYNLLAILQAC